MNLGMHLSDSLDNVCMYTIYRPAGVFVNSSGYIIAAIDWGILPEIQRIQDDILTPGNSQQPHYTTINPSHSMRCARGQSALDDSYGQRNNRERLLGSFGIMEASWDGDAAGGEKFNRRPWTRYS